MINVQLAIVRRYLELLAQFNISLSEVDVHLQQASLRVLEDRGWGRPHQTQSVETSTPAESRPLSGHDGPRLRSDGRWSGTGAEKITRLVRRLARYTSSTISG
jgi:hypothetical protein